MTWDGRLNSYVPSRVLDIDPGLKLHTEYTEELDPITYQVLRSRFWNLNLDHTETIRRLSGSRLVVFMDDFCTSLLAEDGDTIVCGPSLQFFTGMGDLIAKYTLEHRSGNPGIVDGDVFLQNDPYIAAAHQMDTSIYAPFFHDGRLFAWIMTTAHFGDLGGIEPGGFIPSAPDIFSESQPVPPVKLCRDGILQADIAEMFARKSREPDLVALQIRSQLAGIGATRARLEELIGEYGPGVVKGAMRRMIRDCSAAVSRRLRQIPDGIWSERIEFGGAGPNDRGIHAIATSIRKVGDRLYVSNEGTDPQYGASNSTYAAWRSATLGALLTLLAYDEMYCPAGVSEHVEFEPVPGTLNVCSFPAAVTPETAVMINLNVSLQAASKMLMMAPSPTRDVANAIGGVALPGWWVAFGTDRRGRPCGDTTGDSMLGSIGAFSFKDGVDTGGAWWWPQSVAGNVEEWERELPLLYLYRREKVDSGAPGRWEGGNGAELAVMPHKVPRLHVRIVSPDPAINPSRGLAGGYPGHAGAQHVARGTSLRAAFAQGGLPTSLTAITRAATSVGRVPPRDLIELSDSDVLIWQYSSGAGFGDPLRREPSHVRDAVRAKRQTAGTARARYGVVLTADHEVDSEQTDTLRAELRRVRRAEAAPSASAPLKQVLDPRTTPTRLIGDALVLYGVDDRWLWGCGSCGQAFGGSELDYKPFLAARTRTPHQVDPILYMDPREFSDAEMALVELICPRCGELINTELVPRGSSPPRDVTLSDPAFAYAAASTR